MVRYYIKQKVFSWRDQFTVKDEHERDCYYVEGELLTLGKKLRIFTMNDEEIVYIEQKLWRFLPEFNLYVGNKQLATIKKEFHFLKNNYTIYGPDWQIEGNFLAHDYVIKERGKVIADVNKKWLSWGDTYEINILDEAQEDILLGAVIVIDCVISAQRNSSNSN